MRVIISGGGTAGHVYPGLALADQLRAKHPDTELLWVGTAEGLEASVVPKSGFPFATVAAAGLRRGLTFANAGVMAKLAGGSLEARRIVGDYRPDVVVGMGGYVSAPVVLAARLARLPVLLHEQNAIPGLANRLLARFADCVAVSYQQSARAFPPAKVVVTGNPVRPEILTSTREEGLELYRLERRRKTLLVCGGSRGAHKINQAMIESYHGLSGRSDLQVLHVTGMIDFDFVSGRIAELESAADRLTYKVHRYLDRIAPAYAATDLIVCRAGAGTLAEITARGIPSILVPYRHATGGHQDENARVLEEAGACRVIEDGRLAGDLLVSLISELVGDEVGLRKMAVAARSAGHPEAADRLSELVLSVAARGSS